MNIQISPLGSMDLLAQVEVGMLQEKVNSDLYQLFRNCCLATLNAGVKTDNTEDLLDKCADFSVKLISTERGIKIELINPPQTALVDGKIIRSIQANLYAVLRDILFVNNQIQIIHGLFADTFKEHSQSAIITNQVFAILRNAKALHLGEEPDLIACWGGHSINEIEYAYARQVGMELGLRELNICTGCGPGIMEAPMKGAAVGHAQQHYKKSRFIGMTEISIIAAEPPNALVNELVIMPDIEKRLEAFVRMSHGILIFPGGPGTAEELLYLLSILLNPKNKHQHIPLILTGPKESKAYFYSIDEFIKTTLGEQATALYRIILGDAQDVAKIMKNEMDRVKNDRLKSGDAYSFNWTLTIDEDLQHPFIPTHENMAALNLHKEQPVELLSSNLRKAFSGIVAGNIKSFGMQQIKKNGPYQLHGDVEIMKKLETLLMNFVEQDRMKLPGGTKYEPCYQLIY